jgi:glutathione transport system substrate-binding protein
VVTDSAEKAKIYADAQQRIWKDAPWVFLVTEKLLSVRARNLTGFYVIPDGSFNFDEAELK